MGLMHLGICATGLLSALIPLCIFISAIYHYFYQPLSRRYFIILAPGRYGINLKKLNCQTHLEDFLWKCTHVNIKFGSVLPSVLTQCRRKTYMIHQTFVWWAVYIPYKFAKSPIRHLGLAIGNVQCVRCFFAYTVDSDLRGQKPQ